MGEINGQNIIRKYKGMMNKDLEFKKETEEKNNAFMGHKIASIKQGKEAQPQDLENTWSVAYNDK